MLDPDTGSFSYEPDPYKKNKIKTLYPKEEKIISNGFIEVVSISSYKANAYTTNYILHCEIVMSESAQIEYYQQFYLSEQEPPKLDILKITLRQADKKIDNNETLLKNYSIANIDSVIEELKKYIKIKNVSVFNDLLLIYLCYCVENDYTTDANFENGEYIGNALYDIVVGTQNISLYDKSLPKNLFNGQLEKPSAENIFLSSRNFVKLLEKSQNTLLLLAYALASYTMPYTKNALILFYEDNCNVMEDTALLLKQFALHICDNDEDSANTIANLMLNTFTITMRNYKNIKSDEFSICLQKGTEPFYRFDSGLFCPVMIYPDDNMLSSYKKKVQHIAENAENHAIDYWPVFLNQDFVPLDGCLQFNANRFHGLTSHDILAEYKPHINYLYIKYIKYIADAMSKGTYNIPKEFLNIKNSTDNTIDMFRLLNIELRLFSDFLIHFDCCELAEKITELTNMWGLDDLDKLTDPEELTLMFFRQYLKEIFIKKRITPEYIHLADSLADDGPSFYLEGTKYFNDFVNRFPVTVEQRKFNEILKNNNYIRYRENKSIVMKRLDTNCIVVKQSIFENLS